MLNGISKAVNENTKLRLPPGLVAFVSDANRANNNYSLKALIKNQNYRSMNASSWYNEDAYYDDYYLNEYDEMEELTAQSQQLEILRVKLENKLFEELRKGTTQQTVPSVHNIGLNKEKHTVNDLMKAMNDIIHKLCINTLNTDDIITFIQSNGIRWCSFDNRLCRKKVFVLRLRNSFDSINIKYGSAIKIWREMNDIYNATHSHVIIVGEIVPIPGKDRSLIYISETVTHKAIQDDIICEDFANSKQLFHYLRWTIKMQQIDALYKVFKMRIYWDNEDGFEIYRDNELVIFNIELHRNDDIQNDFYIVGHNNDKITIKSPRWKMTEFMTASDICNKYGITNDNLPLGSRSNNAATFKHIVIKKNKRLFVLCGYIRESCKCMINYKICMINTMVLCCYSYYNDDVYSDEYKYAMINQISKDIYVKIPQIKTQQKKEKHKKEPMELMLSSRSFYEYIHSAMNNNDAKHDFIKIVSFDKQKTTYFIDLLLPIKLFNNNWCGLIFRDHLHYLEPIAICIDCNDIKTKSKLFDAAFNVNDQYEWMDNDITRLTLNLSQKLQMKSNNKSISSCHSINRHRLVLKTMMYR